MSKERAAQIITEANSLFVDEDYDNAIRKFNEAITLDNTNSEYYTKRSFCHHKMDNFTESMADAKKAIELDANNAKAYFRKGMAAFSLDEYETSKQAFQKAQELSPSPQNKTWIRKCDAELEDEKDTDEESSEELVVKSPTPANTKPTVDGPPPLELDSPKKAQVSTPSQSAHPPPASQNPLPDNAKESPSSIPIPVTPSPPKNDWYQTNTHVILSILIKNVKKEDAKINIGEKNIEIEVKLPGNLEYQTNFNLLDKIIVPESSYTILSTKIELKLKKSRESRWSTLEDTGGSVQVWDAVVDTKKDKGLIYPSSAKNSQKDWDKVDVPAESDDKLDGDAALNKLFQDIYKGASDDQRRAMLKSFQESGGTVLSTNWDEVGKGEVKGQPPKGMDMKYWKDI
jgi:suppressor of G2 allele of SKP1